jgi:hypothetical protein
MPKQTSSFKRDELRTLVLPAPPGQRIGYSDGILLMGSCFTEHIGNRLKSMKFKTCLNPFGIVYNPLSMAAQLEYLLNPSGFRREDLILSDGLWHSWMHHGRFSSADPDAAIRMMEEEAASAAALFGNARMLLLTFGTAEAWFLHEGDRLVSNCHRVPAGRFYTRRPDPEELASLWLPLIGSLLKSNRNLQIGLTISPVRYFKDGPTASQLSKSTLFLFIEMLMKAFPDLWYFPAYEIFMDDLRDYRFYDTDMVHPGSQGIEYVWNRFSGACIDPAALPVMAEVDSVMKAASHRPQGPVTEAQRRFNEQLVLRMKTLMDKYPVLDFSVEMEEINLR